MWTKGNGVQAADSAIGNYTAQSAELQNEAAAIGASGQVITRQLGEAMAEATELVLPDAAPATLASAAQELAVPWLPNRRFEFEQQRTQWIARLGAIEADPYFVQRESLLHPTAGPIAIERQQCQTLIGQIQTHLSRFQTETYLWIQNRELQRQVQGSGFSSFWDAVTFGGYREDKAKHRCAAELGYQSYDQLVQDHQMAEARMRQAGERVGQLDAHRQRVVALLEEHGNLYGWVNDFEGQLARTLRSELGNALFQQDLRSVHMRIRPQARPAIARAHALQKKFEYLGNLNGFVQGQVSDRNQRIQAIGKTRMSWAMKPFQALGGDKSKWLLALPALKRNSTNKQLSWTRRMHRNIYEYDAYDDYDWYLSSMDDFLPYDAFAWSAREPMPYEGFSRGVVPEIAYHRQQHQQDRADYSGFRAADKEAPDADERAEAMRVAMEEPQGMGTDEDDLSEAAALGATADEGPSVTDAS